MQELVAADSQSVARTWDRAEQELLKEVRVSPTLVKYADPNSYEIETRRELQQIASELIGNVPVAPAPLVDLLDEEPLEIELATTLVYEHCHYPYRQIRQAMQAVGDSNPPRHYRPGTAPPWQATTRCCALSARASSSASTS